MMFTHDYMHTIHSQFLTILKPLSRYDYVYVLGPLRTF